MSACTCWVRVTLHDGHCCFRPEAPDDCHDLEGRAMHESSVADLVRTAMADLCHHCGRSPESDGDHTCPCPYSDADCPAHATSVNGGAL